MEAIHKFSMLFSCPVILRLGNEAGHTLTQFATSRQLEGWLVDLTAVLPSRGTWTRWRHGPAGAW